MATMLVSQIISHRALIFNKPMLGAHLTRTAKILVVLTVMVGGMRCWEKRCVGKCKKVQHIEFDIQLAY